MDGEKGSCFWHATGLTDLQASLGLNLFLVLLSLLALELVVWHVVLTNS